MAALDLARDYPALVRTFSWGNTSLTGCRLLSDTPPLTRLQSVNMVPFVDDRVIVIALESGHFMLPGGTRERDETLLATVTREMMEETGYRPSTCHPFAVLDCVSHDPAPYRPWLAHPEFERLVCFGDVVHAGDPINPDGAEQIAHVDLMTVDRAVATLRRGNRPELADLYALAASIRAGHALPDLVIDDLPVTP